MEMDEHFIILGLPRSMTAWVSCFLTCGEVFCQHELAEKMPIKDIIDEIRSPIFPVSGICDSGLIFHWKKMVEAFPNARFAYIDRDSDECVDSLMGLGLSCKAASDIVRGPVFQSWDFCTKFKPEIFEFDELQTEAGAKRLWDYCAPHHPLPPAHLRKMMSLKVTVHPKVYREAADALNVLTAQGNSIFERRDQMYRDATGIPN